MEEWVKASGARVVVVFEGRDAAGKGGAIKRITEHMNPRIASIVALPKPTERERTQWYFQRYVEQLPAAGEIVLFDRSWYNRAGVEKVLGFCTPEEHRGSCASARSSSGCSSRTASILIKYWFSVSRRGAGAAVRARIDDPMRRWKLSRDRPVSRTKWVDYSRAKDEMFVHTDIPEAPWYVVEADDKRRARINCIAHLLSQVPYESTARARRGDAGATVATRATCARLATSTPTCRTTPRRCTSNRKSGSRVCATMVACSDFPSPSGPPACRSSCWGWCRAPAAPPRRRRPRRRSRCSSMVAPDRRGRHDRRRAAHPVRSAPHRGPSARGRRGGARTQGVPRSGRAERPRRPSRDAPGNWRSDPDRGRHRQDGADRSHGRTSDAASAIRNGRSRSTRRAGSRSAAASPARSRPSPSVRSAVATCLGRSR